VDPGGLTYESTKPAGEGRWALYAVNSDPFVQGLTALAAAPGQPGPIVDLPLFDFAVFPPGTLAEGVNHVGIACTLANETIRYWDTDLVLTDTPEDEPAQLTWVAVDPPEVAAEGNRLPWIAVGVLAAGLGLLALVRRRRREPAA
jgi:hypothetical protein